MEFMPRITRAQSMDMLSSQSNLAGYKAVLDAADEYGRAFPMMMTAAGTVAAARGVRDGRRRRRPAGDRHRAAAGRAGLGDRRARGDQGADPVARRQADLRRERRRDRGRGRAAATPPRCPRNTRRRRPSWSPSHIAKQDIVITTALIPGRAGAAADHRRADRDDEARQRDLRSRGGAGRQCRGLRWPARWSSATASRSSATRTPPRTLAADASALYARNLFNFLSAFWDKEQGKPGARRGDRRRGAADAGRRGREREAEGMNRHLIGSRWRARCSRRSARTPRTRPAVRDRADHFMSADSSPISSGSPSSMSTCSTSRW